MKPQFTLITDIKEGISIYEHTFDLPLHMICEVYPQFGMEYMCRKLGEFLGIPSSQVEKNLKPFLKVPYSCIIAYEHNNGEKEAFIMAA